AGRRPSTRRDLAPALHLAGGAEEDGLAAPRDVPTDQALSGGHQTRATAGNRTRKCQEPNRLQEITGRCLWLLAMKASGLAPAHNRHDGTGSLHTRWWEEPAMVVYAFDVDETLEVSKGPVRLLDLAKLPRYGHTAAFWGIG